MTTVLAHPVALEDFAAFARQLELAVAEESEAGVDGLSQELNASVVDAVSDHDLARMARLGSRIARLKRRLTEASDADAAIRDKASGYLALMLSALDRARATALTARLVERDAREIELLRDRILALLREEPARPRDLADALGVDPTQISRSLRELVESSRVKPTDAPREASDKRARWYDVMEPQADRSGMSVRASGDTMLVTVHRSAVRVLAMLDAEGHVSAVDADGRQARERDRTSLADALQDQQL